MWRIANCVYRAFRHTATHRCSQDILIPLTTVCSTDDETNSAEKEKCVAVIKYDFNQILKNNQFSFQNIEKVQEYLKHLFTQQLTKKSDVVQSIEPPAKESSPANKRDQTLDSILQTDQTCVDTIKNLSDLHDETMSIINLQLALDALESGDTKFGIETLQNCAKNGTNAAALYNLGICYERGIGVEQDRAKGCDYYRQASALGHITAQFNLTLLSNDIDINEEDDETSNLSINQNQKTSLPQMFSRFSFSSDYREDQSLDNHPMDFTHQTIACL